MIYDPMLWVPRDLSNAYVMLAFLGGAIFGAVVMATLIELWKKP